VIRLGHIEYSNCFPVHALLLDRGVPPGIELVMGTPAELNAALAAGRVDVAPCSSIEYARHAAEYRLLPGLAIASEGAVGSILLETAVRLEELGGRDIAVPTASATSVVLLRALLEERLGIRPVYHWFEQSRDADPIAAGATAALWIGDVALVRPAVAGRSVIDLGRAWTEWTGLPFVYALWQARWDERQAHELLALHELLLASFAYFGENASALAERHAAAFGITADRLLRYWQSLRYVMDERLERGLLRFYESAARLGEALAVRAFHWVEIGVRGTA
jgi:chorismate dehydratase